MALDRMSSFDRVPPQNLEAEQAVLGSMLIERPAVEKAAEILKADDFYRDAHRYIFEAMLALAERDEPVDILTVMDELNGRDRGEIAGGRFYLQNLMEAPATAANIEYYARMVEEKAILRKLMDVGTQIQGLAYSEFDTVDDVVDRAEKLVFEIGQRRMGQFFYHIRPLLDEELDRIEKRYENRDSSASGGRMTPFADLNWKTNGLNPSDLIIVAARPGMGKCLPAYTLIDNPLTGERQTLEQCIREKMPTIFGISEAGQVRVTAVSDWIDSGIQPCYRVRTRTGRSVDVTGHHPFLTVQGWTPLHCLEVGNKIGVPRAVPCFGQDDYAPGLARLMAYFLAEGGLSGTSPRFTNVDPIIIADFKAQIALHFPECVLRQYGIDYAVVQKQRSNRPNPVTTWLRDLQLMGKKAEAKRFPVCVWKWNKERLAEFLRILFSCDGTIYSMGGYGRIEFAVASETLAGDVHHILTRFGVVSKLWRKTERCWRVEITEPQSVATYQQEIGWLGEKATRVFRTPNAIEAAETTDTRRSIVGHPPQEVWSLVWAEAVKAGLSLSELARRCGEKGAGKDGYNPHTNRSLPRTRLARYAEVLQSARLRQIASADLYWDEIVSIQAIGSHQVYDLTVPDGANFIAQSVCVHNTSLTVQLAQFIAMNEKVPVAIFSLEMSKEQLVTRMICSESKVDASRLRNGSLQSDDWQRVGEGISRLSEAPIYIDDSPDISAMEMRAKCRRLKAEQGLGLIVIDYLQLMRSHKKTDNRTQEISEIARACKQLARELRVPVIALSQLSRAVESRPDKRPMLSDLRESGSIEAEADIVMFIYRDAYYKSKEEGAEDQQGNRDSEKLEETELILAKHRSGPTGKVFVGFLPHYTRFEDLTDRVPGDMDE